MINNMIRNRMKKEIYLYKKIFIFQRTLDQELAIFLWRAPIFLPDKTRALSYISLQMPLQNLYIVFIFHIKTLIFIVFTVFFYLCLPSQRSQDQARPQIGERPPVYASLRLLYLIQSQRSDEPKYTYGTVIGDRS